MFMTDSSNIGLSCDVCGRVVQGITYMNGMKFCAKCYQETFGKPEIVVSWAKDNPFEELEQENKILRRALELACIEHKTFGYCCYCDDKCDKTELTCEECLREYFIDQAKKENNND